jgi:hypothetical protein
MGAGIREGLIVLRGRLARIATGVEKGEAIQHASDYPYGEAIELRYDWRSASAQFQAIFARVAAAAGAAHTGTLRGAEFDARNEGGQNGGTIVGLHGTSSGKGTGTTTAAFGLNGEVSMDADVARTFTLLAGVRSKIQSEDAATITEGYGFLGENEAVTGGKTLTALLGGKNTAGLKGWKAIIDVSGGELEIVNTDQVRLIVFDADDGTKKMLVYDRSADVTSVINYA